mgnify:CR=1 FL=1
MKDLMKNKTVIAVAHRLSTLKEMDRIIVLNKGTIVEDGKIAYKELIDLSQDKTDHVSWVKNWMEKHIEWSEN